MSQFEKSGAGALERTAGAPSEANPFDPFDLISAKTGKVLAAGATGGIIASGLKLGTDAVAFSNYGTAEGAAGWLGINPITLEPTVSAGAPKLFRGWIESGSPTAQVARQAAQDAALSSQALAEQTTKYLKGGKLFGSNDVFGSLAEQADAWSAARHPGNMINANASVKEVLGEVQTKLGRISGQAERYAVLNNLTGLQSEVGVAERPFLQAAKGNLLSGLAQGAVVGGASYLIDGQLSKYARSAYGNDSQLAKVLEPTLTGALLTGAGCALGTGWRSKLALSAVGWVSGKALNYFQ